MLQIKKAYIKINNFRRKLGLFLGTNGPECYFESSVFIWTLMVSWGSYWPE